MNVSKQEYLEIDRDRAEELFHDMSKDVFTHKPIWGDQEYLFICLHGSVDINTVGKRIARISRRRLVKEEVTSLPIGRLIAMTFLPGDDKNIPFKYRMLLPYEVTDKSKFILDEIYKHYPSCEVMGLSYLGRGGCINWHKDRGSAHILQYCVKNPGKDPSMSFRLKDKRVVHDYYVPGESFSFSGHKHEHMIKARVERIQISAKVFTHV